MRVKKTAVSLLVMGMAVQILLGAGWLLCNATAAWTYPESAYYLSVADTFVMDEYTGVLYPVLIRACQIVEGGLGLPFEGVLSLLQIVVAFFCYSGFVALCRSRNGEKNRKQHGFNIFGGLYLLTVPLCVQWHLSVLVRSLVSSLFLLALGLCVRAARHPGYANGKFWITANGFWVILALLSPDYVWLGLILVIFAAILVVRARKAEGKKCGKKAVLLSLAVFLVAGGLAAGINPALQSPGSSGKIQRSLGAAMLSRMVWPNFDTNYFFWPQEIKDIMTLQEGRDISAHADLVQTAFGPLVEKTYGKEKANEFYWQMALNCMGIRTKEIIKAVYEDFTAYFFPPWKVKSQLDGSGLSFSGWHYDKMRTRWPRLTRLYVDYGLVSFRVGLLTVCGLLVLRVLKERREKAVWGMFLCVALSQAFWYTMAAGGMMDYGNVPVVILLWYSVILFGARPRMEEELG